jgi:hypothetical protein
MEKYFAKKVEKKFQQEKNTAKSVKDKSVKRFQNNAARFDRKSKG